jgi:hypothetical protein
LARYRNNSPCSFSRRRSKVTASRIANPLQRMSSVRIRSRVAWFRRSTNGWASNSTLLTPSRFAFRANGVRYKASRLKLRAKARSRLCKCYCMKLKRVCNQLIIDEIVVEAAGVELSSVLRTRNLLILGTATRAKKGPIARSIVRLLYENALALESRRPS